MNLVMVTGNRHKFLETLEIARSMGIRLIQKPFEIREVRGTLEEIARDKAEKAFAAVGRPVICDDSGFFVDALNGFPGEFSAFVFGKIGVSGILKLMKGVADRGAEFRCAACYYDGGRFVVKPGVVRGTIPEEARGSRGFGYDPIFVPEGHTRTFAEDFGYKMKVSHRRRAFQALFEELSKKFHKEQG